MSSIVISGDTSGAVTIAVPAVAGTNTVTLPALTGTVVVAGQNSAITSGTAQASTSGTSIDFSSIPSWAKSITVLFNGVSTNGSSNCQIQLGTSGGIVTSGYSGYYFLNAVYRGGFSSAFIVRGLTASNSTLYGSAQICLLTGNTWVETGVVADSTYSQDTTQSGGGITLSSALTTIRITTVNGTDVFDAGNINIIYG